MECKKKRRAPYEYEDIPWLYPGWEIQIHKEDLMSINEVLQIIVDSIHAKKPLSVIRIGDGELYVMSQNIVLSSEYLAKYNIAWNSTKYCGVSLKQDMLNNFKMRDRLIDAVKTADLVGVFPNGVFTNKMFSALHFKPARLFYAFSNLSFCKVKCFVDMLKADPPLLVGKPSKDFADYLEKALGVHVPGYFTDISCPEDIDKTIEIMARTPHNWSLVSAGVNADIIAPIMAKEYGKVCIDYGHGMNVLMEEKYNGRYYFYGQR